LVPFLFGLLHGRHLKALGIQVHHHRLDAIANLPALLQTHPEACLWFDNVLGQVGFRLGDEDMAERQLGQLKTMLQGRAWGSLHDVYSGPIDPALPLPSHDTLTLTRLDDLPEESAQVKLGPKVMAHADAAQALLATLNATGVWHDHSTQTVFAVNTSTTLLPWAFKPHYWHWLQAAWVKP